MKDLVVHPATRRRFDSLVGAPAHAVLLVGPPSSGKRSLAIRLSESIIGLPPDSFADYPYKMTITAEEGKSIGIEAVREIEHFLSLKVPDADPAAHNRAVIIEDAHLMTAEAQNALLKTLEEPPAGTFIILTAAGEQALLPTIRSRAQAVSVKRPGKAAVEAYFQALDFGQQAIGQTYAISGGLPGLMRALLEETDHPLRQATEQARRLLSQPVYERLLAVDELSKQRQLALDTTFILQQMARVSLLSATGAAAAKWRNVLTASYRATEALTNSVQPKLALTNLMLSF